MNPEEQAYQQRTDATKTAQELYTEAMSELVEARADYAKAMESVFRKLRRHYHMRGYGEVAITETLRDMVSRERESVGQSGINAMISSKK